MNWPDDYIDKIICGGCLEVMKGIPDGAVQTCITSPPYWGLRDYGVDGQIGVEDAPSEYVASLVGVFSEIWRILRNDGTVWLNLGDCYASKNGAITVGDPVKSKTIPRGSGRWGGGNRAVPGLKNKDLVGIPWGVAFALRGRGWYLRSDIIWAKPNPMPESVKDRPTRSHEYIFLLSKSERYYYDYEAIAEDAKYVGIVGMDATGYKDAKQYNGKHARADKQRGHRRRHAGFNDRWDKTTKQEQCSGKRNKRDVWEVATRPFPAAHFAVFPPDLIDPCILAGSREGDIVLDPFCGSGTTAMRAKQLSRRFVTCDLNPDYCKIAEQRLAQEELFKPEGR